MCWSCQLVQYVFSHGPFRKTETKSFMLSSQWIFIKRQPMHNPCIIALLMYVKLISIQERHSSQWMTPIVAPHELFHKQMCGFLMMGAVNWLAERHGVDYTGPLSTLSQTQSEQNNRLAVRLMHQNPASVIKT